jgi:hypothetical protein
MKRVTLALVVLGVVALTANLAAAGDSTITLVGHSVHRGYSSGHYGGYPSYGYGQHGYGRAPVIVRPMVPAYPAIVYPAPRHAPVVHPPVHSRYRSRYYCEPQWGFHYRGSGFGFSFSF